MANWYKSAGKHPEHINDMIWRMFGVNLNTGEHGPHPDKEPHVPVKKERDGECAHSMDMHCDGGDDGW